MEQYHIEPNRPRKRAIPHGGHFPGHLRDEFATAIYSLHDARHGSIDDAELAVALKAIRRLWNCRDVLPSVLRTAIADLTDQSVGSYAQGARVISEFWVDE